MKIVTLCREGSCCPVVKISNEHVEIGEKNNVCVLTKTEWEVLKNVEGFTINISTKNLARNVYLSADEFEGHFSDNYFDLMPGETKEIKFIAGEQIVAERFSEALKVISLVDAF